MSFLARFLCCRRAEIKFLFYYLVAAVRDVNKDNAKELAKLGVQLRVAEYSDPAGLEKVSTSPAFVISLFVCNFCCSSRNLLHDLIMC